jgi:outer membrane protein with beta-barrel domain
VSHGPLRRAIVFVSAMWLQALPATAQDVRRAYVGGVAGMSTLQADGRSVATASEAAVSLYKPENGPALNLFAGLHLAQYLTVQANWMWNRNDIALLSSIATAQRGAFYEQQRQSRQHVAVFDGLVYFRRLDSRLRPYLGTGLALIWFTSDTIVSSSAHGLEPPAGTIASTRIGLRSHVGIDVVMSRRLTFRYSFSETISGNPISPSLTPPGQRRLANFQNLFGIVGRF